VVGIGVQESVDGLWWTRQWTCEWDLSRLYSNYELNYTAAHLTRP